MFENLMNQPVVFRLPIYILQRNQAHNPLFSERFQSRCETGL